MNEFNKKNESSEIKVNEKQINNEQELQHLLKNFNKKNQETRRAERRHQFYLSPRDQKREKQIAAAKKKKYRK